MDESKVSTEPVKCNHGIVFDAEACKGLTASEIRKKFPRFNGYCAACGYDGIYYVSFQHYIYGNW